MYTQRFGISARWGGVRKRVYNVAWVVTIQLATASITLSGSMIQPYGTGKDNADGQNPRTFHKLMQEQEARRTLLTPVELGFNVRNLPVVDVKSYYNRGG